MTGLSTAVLKGDEAAEVEAMAAAERSRCKLAVAQAAEVEIGAGLPEAEATVRSCRTAVEKAARAVCAEAYRELREEIAVLEDQTERLRRRSRELAAVADYPPARWQPHLRTLLEGPEASIEQTEAEVA